MMYLRDIVVLTCASALGLTACDKKAEAPATGGTAEAPADDEAARAQAAAAKVGKIAEDREAAAQVGEALQKGDPTALATAQGGGGKLDCDVVLPTAMREKYMKGVEIQAGSLVNRTLMCSGNRGGAMAYQVTLDCRPTTTLAAFQDKSAEEVQGGKRVIAGLGRAAFGSDTAVEFYDDDADCAVTASAYGEGDKVGDLAKDIAATLKPDLLPPVQKGKYTLDCDKLVPPALRDKFLPGTRLQRDSIRTDQMECKFKHPDFKVTSVSYTCGGSFGPDFLPKMKEQLEKSKQKVENVAVGQGALYHAMMGTHSVSLVDAETGCLVALMTMTGDKARAVELAKGIEAALTKDAVQ